MKIYIGFAAPNSGFVPFAWLIQYIEKRNYDHCYIRFQEPTGDWMIFQASGFAVNLYNKHIWLVKNKSIKEYEIEVTDEQNIQFWTFIKANLGIPYSLKEDFGILLMKIFKLSKNPYASGYSAEFCSQLAARVCRLFNIKFSQPTSTIDPSALDNILSQAGLQCNTNPSF